VTINSEATSADADPPSGPRLAGEPKTAVLVLAAGHGTRLNSAIPKHLHPVAGIPIVKRVIRAGKGANPLRTICLVSPSMADLDHRLDMAGQFETVIQEPALGTGDAVRIGLEAIDDDIDWVVCLLGDSCLLTSEMVRLLLNRAISEASRVTVLTAKLPDARAYGRIARDEYGRVTAIIEKKSDDPAKRTGITEINSGIMALNARWARQALPKILPNPDSKEIQLTDLIELAVDEHREGNAWPVQTFIGDKNAVVGVNDRVQLMEADQIVRKQVRDRLLNNGVSIVGPDTVFIDEDVEIGRDTVIHPFTTITGRTRLGDNCVVGPNAHLSNVISGDHVTIVSSTIRDSELGSNVDIGPYSHLRSGTHIHDSVHIGNFAEIKNSTVGSDTRIGHVGYLGDATIEHNVNIGAGTITANFDGVEKHRTVIRQNAFVGSDSVLVAPVEIGHNGRTGAGAVVTHDVAPDSTVVGVPARPMVARSTTSDNKE
jgi:bifunctional UDP-N-acetylglucosamine pyrophosphorylase/glucosamine-1-phosphate N-acetyltransferase